MSSFVNPLARNAPSVVGKARDIKQWTRDALGLPAETVISVNELACHVPGCPPKETIVLVMREAQSAQISLHKALLDVTADDILEAFAVAGRGIG